MFIKSLFFIFKLHKFDNDFTSKNPTIEVIYLTPKEKFEQKEAKNLLLLATRTGSIMLQNGAETYRVEDTIVRMCKSRKYIQAVDAFVTPTGIFASLECQGELTTNIQRIKSIKIDLNKVDLINNFSRKFVNSNMSTKQGMSELAKINMIKSYKQAEIVIYGSLSAAFFSILFGGAGLDFISSFLVSIIVIMCTTILAKYDVSFFISNFCGAAIASLLSILFFKMGLGENMDKIIIGSLMPLVPGVSITNAIRDTISGDFVSGLSRGMEAFVIASAIAFGAGFILNIYFKGMV